MAASLDLPKNHALRATMEEFKKRFEEYNDEPPDSMFFLTDSKVFQYVLKTSPTISSCLGDMIFPFRVIQVENHPECREPQVFASGTDPDCFLAGF